MPVNEKAPSELPIITTLSGKPPAGAGALTSIGNRTVPEDSAKSILNSSSSKLSNLSSTGGGSTKPTLCVSMTPKFSVSSVAPPAKLHLEGKPAPASSVPCFKVKVTSFLAVSPSSPRTLTMKVTSLLVEAGIVKLAHSARTATLLGSLEDKDSPIPPVGAVALPPLPSPKLKRKGTNPTPSTSVAGLSEAKDTSPLASPSSSIIVRV